MSKNGETLEPLDGLPSDLNAWVRCPACGDGGHDLLAGRYPVTNYQFSLFMAAGGYATRAYWSEAGWRWRLSDHNADWRGKEPVTEPGYWRDERFGRAARAHPVVGVSWYEAEAYCAWLTELLARARRGGDGVTADETALIADLLAAGASVTRLPSEGEWVCLAGGAAGNRYPWEVQAVTSGRDEAEVTVRANVRETGIWGTTRVAKFPQGASWPHGLMDMAGNVWEWTRENALRGGSWGDYMHYARVSARFVSYPSSSVDHVGFRVVSPVAQPDTNA